MNLNVISGVKCIGLAHGLEGGYETSVRNNCQITDLISLLALFLLCLSCLIFSCALSQYQYKIVSSH